MEWMSFFLGQIGSIVPRDYEKSMFMHFIQTEIQQKFQLYWRTVTNNITTIKMSFQIYITYHMMKGVVLYFVLLSLALVAMTTRGDCDSEVQCARKSRDRLLLCHSSCNTLPRSRLTCLKTCYLDAYGKIKDCIEEERKTKWCKI